MTHKEKRATKDGNTISPEIHIWVTDAEEEVLKDKHGKSKNSKEVKMDKVMYDQESLKETK